MNRLFCLIISVYLVGGSSVYAQDLRLPREPDRLIDRVQKFWLAMTSGQRSRAVEFVLPDKKDLFLSGTPMPILKASVVGVDLTTDRDHAAVRINLEMLSKESASGRSNWTIADAWVWSRDNWYFDVQKPPDLFPKGGSTEILDPKQVQKQIEKNFEILLTSIDAGRLIQGQHLQVEIPIKYSGDVTLSVEILPNPLVDLLASSTKITSNSKKLLLIISGENWDGPFTLPLPLKISYQGATVERTVSVKGEVFVPIVFRQEPANTPIEAGHDFSVFIRNNSDQQAGIRNILVDGKLIILTHPQVLPPHGEEEVVFRPRPGVSPDQLLLELDAPLYGRDNYTYRFRNVHR